LICPTTSSPVPFPTVYRYSLALRKCDRALCSNVSWRRLSTSGTLCVPLSCRSLDLSDNSFTGTLPSDFTMLQCLGCAVQSALYVSAVAHPCLRPLR
jgi:hypothetical protein